MMKSVNYMFGLLGVAMAAAAAEPADINNVAPAEAARVADYRAQARQGSAQAQWQLAECYRQGLGVTPDAAKAFALYQQSARQGYIPAMHAVAVCYTLGVGTEPQPAAALPLLEQCAKQGYLKSVHALCKTYTEGIAGVVAPDYPRALELAMQGVAVGNKECLQGAGILLLVPDYGFNRVEEGMDLLRQAVQQGDGLSAYQLAVVYLGGEFGVTKDYEQAVSWLKRGVELGNADSAYLLGGCYLEGVGVAPDAAQAIPLLQQAAEQALQPFNRAAALHALALCYYFGRGVEPSLPKAEAYARAAAALGHEGAAAMLRDLQDGSAPPPGH